MDILIIGNGFDLAHDLKTTYKDFLDYCEKLPLDDNFRNNLWLKYFWEATKNNTINGSTWIDFETEIYNHVLPRIIGPKTRIIIYHSEDLKTIFLTLFSKRRRKNFKTG